MNGPPHVQQERGVPALINRPIGPGPGTSLQAGSHHIPLEMCFAFVGVGIPMMNIMYLKSPWDYSYGQQAPELLPSQFATAGFQASQFQNPLPQPPTSATNETACSPLPNYQCKYLQDIELSHYELDAEHSHVDGLVALSSRRDRPDVAEHLKYSLLDDHAPSIVMPGTRKVVESILRYSDKHQTNHLDYDEFSTGLKFWAVSVKQERKLIREWYFLFKKMPEYLKTAPVVIQQVVNTLSAKDAAKLPSIEYLMATEAAEERMQVEREQEEWAVLQKQEDTRRIAVMQTAAEEIKKERAIRSQSVKRQPPTRKSFTVDQKAKAVPRNEGSHSEARQNRARIQEYLEPPMIPSASGASSKTFPASMAKMYNTCTSPADSDSSVSLLKMFANSPQLLGKRNGPEEDSANFDIDGDHSGNGANRSHKRVRRPVGPGNYPSRPRQPAATKQRRRGITHYKFSAGRLRSAREISGIPDSELPYAALHSDEHELRSHCTAPNVDLTYCDFPVSVEEILTYFPLHTIWRGISLRLATHGWTGGDIVQFIFASRAGLSDEGSVSRTLIQKAFDRAKHWKEKNPGHTIEVDMGGLDKASGLTSINRDYIDYFLVDLAEGVTKHPEGKGAQSLTRAIRHAVNNDHTKIKLSEVVQYINDWNLHPPAKDAFSRDAKDEDVQSAGRLGKVAYNYYRKKFGHGPP